MKTNNIDAVRAYVTLRELNKYRFNDGHIAKKVYDMMNALQSTYDFHIQEEKKIYDQHPNFDLRTHGINIKESGITMEKAQEEIKQIDEALEKLANLESDLDYESFEIDLSTENVPLSGEDYGNLKGFVDFI